MLKDKTIINIVKKEISKDIVHTQIRESKYNTAKTYIFYLPEINREFKICISINADKLDVLDECKKIKESIFEYKIRNAMANEEY